MMKNAISVFLIINLASACAFNEGSKSRNIIESVTSQSGKPLPEPSPSFLATEVLPYSKKLVYAAALEIIDEQRISIINENKDDGRISTDYVAGPSYSILGILGGNSTRYKYLISTKTSGSGTSLKVTAYIESSGAQLQSWRDISADNLAVVSKIENALIEKIELRLKK